MTEASHEERILIFAPTGKDAELTCQVLQAAGLDGVACRNADQLLAEMANGLAALLVVEEALTAEVVNRLSYYVASQPYWADLPILLLTSVGASSPVLNKPIQTLGNITLLERPVRTLALISAAGSALRARKRQYGLREAEERKDEFLASLGHELRNPLAPVRTSMGVLRQLHAKVPDVVNVCDIVDRQVTHLTRLVDDLLDVARITRGKIAMQRAPTSLAAVINQAAEMCAALADKAGHQIIISLPMIEVPLVADHARLVQSVANVLANAIKFTPRPAKITLRADLRQNGVTIRVRDPGVGMERAALTRIFDLFAQGDVGAGQIKGGLGIGLSLARQFIELHGGTIRAHSEGPGRGSEFIITIPRNAIARGSSDTAAQSPRPAANDPAPVKVLVVDDNRDAADTLALLFRTHGFTVSQAYDGEQALHEAGRVEPDAVVMDLGMPGVDGYEAARRIREKFREQRLVLIALTGWGQEGTRKKAIEAGFDFHVVKPVDFEVLKGYIAQS